MVTLIATEESRQDVDELAAFFEGLSNPTIDMQKQVGNVVRSLFANHFAEEGSDVSGPWADLKDSTQIERKMEGYNPDHPILERSGYYRESFTNVNSPSNFEFTEFRNDGWAMEFGSEDWRVNELEKGRPRMFARPVTKLSSGERDEIGDMLELMFQQAATDYEDGKRG
ncbi:MAG: hypothetical protein E4H01_06120 [Lysobacterales bacterium]|nr:MAG: hypothetical protein E4H01_06120 [Xanthomonadales bacterium]